MAAPDVEAQIAEIQAALTSRCEELGVQVADEVWRKVSFYPSAGRPEGIGEIRQSCTANLRFILDGLSPAGMFDTAVAIKTGVDDAEAGIPLQALMEAYRIGCQMVWDEIITLADARPHIGKEALIRATERIWMAQDVLTRAAASGYRDETVRQAVAHESARAALVEALFEGQVTEQTTLWEVAAMLRLPVRGPYVVVAAHCPAIGTPALPDIEAKLSPFGIRSAWRLLPDVQLGLVHLSSDDMLDSLKRVLTRVAATRIGVSSPFDNLTHVVDAVTYARIALSSDRPDGSLLAVFDADSLAIAAVSAPRVMKQITETILGSLDGLDAHDRDTLLATFRAWVACRGSVATASERLFCHPNTVRHRLKRIEKMTGKSLDHPRELAELCLAVEIDLRLP